MPAQEADYSKENWEKRISALPGLTGLAQVNPSDSMELRNFYDYKYIDQQSFKVDLLIVYRTINKLLFHRSF